MQSNTSKIPQEFTSFIIDKLRKEKEPISATILCQAMKTSIPSEFQPKKGEFNTWMKKLYNIDVDRTNPNMPFYKYVINTEEKKIEEKVNKKPSAWENKPWEKKPREKKEEKSNEKKEEKSNEKKEEKSNEKKEEKSNEKKEEKIDDKKEDISISDELKQYYETIFKNIKVYNKYWSMIFKEFKTTEYNEITWNKLYLIKNELDQNYAILLMKFPDYKNYFDSVRIDIMPEKPVIQIPQQQSVIHNQQQSVMHNQQQSVMRQQQQPVMHQQQPVMHQQRQQIIIKPLAEIYQSYSPNSYNNQLTASSSDYFPLEYNEGIGPPPGLFKPPPMQYQPSSIIQPTTSLLQPITPRPGSEVNSSPFFSNNPVGSLLGLDSNNHKENLDEIIKSLSHEELGLLKQIQTMLNKSTNNNIWKLIEEIHSIRKI